jgi:hypothetical protein
MQASDIDVLKQKFNKYLTIFYILCMVALCLACLPVVVVVLFFQTLRMGEKK